jgi:hypothetical protein
MRGGWDYERHPFGGGFEYLHRDPASRTRRRKGKSQIWDSKIWSRVQRDSNPRKTMLTRASSIYKRQTRPLVREGASETQDRNCQRVINIWSWAPDGARHQDLLIDWQSVAMWLWLWLMREDPFGGGVEYLHRDPASRTRRRKGKSQNWDSKMWSRDPRDSDPLKTALARASSIYKRQTCPLVREGAPQNQASNCQTIINIWSWAPHGTRHQDVLIDRPSVAMYVT